jgi:hypothetical protein
MTDDMDFTFDDFEQTVEETIAESTEASTEIKAETKEVSAESETNTEAESTETEELKADETGEDSGAESPTEEYTPDFKYSVKDEEKEFPKWMQEGIKSKEDEESLRDLFTKVEGLDGIKESRTKLEEDFTTYRDGVTNDIYPVLDKIAEFDKANTMKDFGKAWELSDVKPTDVIDFMMMDKELSQTLYEKVLEQINLEPQALEAQRVNYQGQQSTQALQMQNDNLNARLNSMEANTYSQALEFAISQSNDKATAFDAINGEGAFRGFVNEFSAMKKQGGLNLQPHEAVSQASAMLGLSTPGQANTGTIINNQELPQVTPQATKQPQPLPNVGTGSNVSMVQKQATNYDDWETNLQNA